MALDLAGIFPPIPTPFEDSGTISPAGLRRNLQFLSRHALSGVVVLGLLCGRREPRGDKTTAYALAAELQKSFVQEYGTTQCAQILAAFGQQQNMNQCRRLSGRTACMLAGIIGDVPIVV